MPYSFLEHTADIRMDVQDGTFPGLFTQAMLGMFAFLRPLKGAKEARRRVEVRSADRTALLIDFLNEVLSLAQTHKESYDSIEFDKIVEHELGGWLRGNSVKSFGEDIKAVTYHEAVVEHRSKDGWHARVIFDI
jgi:SHS2 domain-containing protein